MTDRGIRMFHVVSMRIAIITDSFAPDLNGVANCVLRVAEHLIQRGHQPLIIAPEPAGKRMPGPFPYPVERVPSMSLPGYPGFRLGLPSRVIRSALASHGTELVHLASPVFLGAAGSTAARHLGLPTVAVYQTDIPAYARAYGWHGAGEAAAWRWLRRIHNAAERTLAPSTAILRQLRAHGFERVWLWGRGVDLTRFAPGKRSAAVRRELAKGGEVLAGYVGRLAIEKRVDLLAAVAELPGVRLVVVGGGPAEASLRERMPSAVFLCEQRARNSRGPTPAWTCSCTAGRTRRSARRSRRPRPVACRSWRPLRAVRSISSITVSPAILSRQGTGRPSQRRWLAWPLIPGCGRIWAAPPGATS